jgi:F0F1-type ATP synthase assembly protein I
MASPPPAPQKNPDGIARQFALAMELPFLLVGGALVGGFLGFLLDRWLHTKPILMLVLGGLGFIASVRDMLRRLQKNDPDNSGNAGK